MKRLFFLSILLSIFMIISCKRISDANADAESTSVSENKVEIKETPSREYTAEEKELLALSQTIFATLPSLEDIYKEENFSKEMAELGRMLYFDPRLSKGQTVSCNSCHNLALYGVDNMSLSQGHKGVFGGRNSPTVLNSAFNIAQFWDGRAKDVEEQAGGPMLNPVEMAMPSEEAVEIVLQSIPGYKQYFDRVFGKENSDEETRTFANATKAIGAFERTLVTPSRFDEYLKGNIDALTEAERGGLKKFIETGCVTCHIGVNIGGDRFQKFGLVREPYWQFTSSKNHDEGRFEHTAQDSDKFFFKVPTLRNIDKTFPYFHDGSIWDLHKSVDIMAQAQLGRELPTEDIDSIVTFLKSLTGDISDEVLKLPILPTSSEDTPKPDNK